MGIYITDERIYLWLFYSRQFPVGRIATEQVIDECQALLGANNLHRYYVRMVVPVDRGKLR